MSGQRIEAADKRTIGVYKTPLSTKKETGFVMGGLQERTVMNGVTCNKSGCRNVEISCKTCNLIGVNLDFFCSAALQALLAGEAERRLPVELRSENWYHKVLFLL